MGIKMPYLLHITCHRQRAVIKELGGNTSRQC